MLIVDTEGLSVLTAVAAGKLNETLVRDSIKKFEVENEVSHKTLIIPGYSAPLSGRIEEATGGRLWSVPATQQKLESSCMRSGRRQKTKKSWVNFQFNTNS